MINKYTAAIIAILLLIIGLSGGCAADPPDESARENANGAAGPIIVSGAEARELLENNDNAVLLDVRNQNEFDRGHIDGAILIPVDQLKSRLSELPDQNAVIIVYCRAGSRSATASATLAENGYTNVYDLGGMDNWG